MQKWEYAFVDLEQPLLVDDEPNDGTIYLKLPNEEGRNLDSTTVANVVNKLGLDGWEVVGYASPMMSIERFVLKRQTTSDAAPESFR
jgi:hypothetical protein